MAARFTSRLSCLGAPMTLALHFNYNLRGEWPSGTSVAVQVLERVMLEVRPHLISTRSVILRMDKLLYSHELNDRNEKLWRLSLDTSRRWRGPWHKVTLGGDLGCPLDRVLVVVISGLPSDASDKVCKRLERFRTHRFLGALIVDKADQIHKALYLSERMTLIGVCHPDWTMECAVGCLEYSPEIERMWAKHGIESYFSKAGMNLVLGLLDPSPADADPRGPDRR
jgi:hypothetical protein